MLENLNLKKLFPSQNFKETEFVKNIRPLVKATHNDLTFFDNLKYKNHAMSTKAPICITTKSLEKFLPQKVKKILVDNVLYELAKALKNIFPDADIDFPDNTLKPISEKKFENIEFGKNVLVGENVSFGSNCIIGHNSIIEKNVNIGNNCSIGSNTIIRNTIIKDNVRILDGCVIGKHGFGFFPVKNQNLRYPHIGIVIIEDNCEIGCGATIDRGSMSNTVIGKNTYLDNQIHIAHNVKIGENSIIAGQVGIAGSSVIGNNVKIGGQAGISGHLKIGNNVEIGGGSGVIRDVPDNTKVMGYPAKNIREFLRDNK